MRTDAQTSAARITIVLRVMHKPFEGEVATQGFLLSGTLGPNDWINFNNQRASLLPIMEDVPTSLDLFLPHILNVSIPLP